MGVTEQSRLVTIYVWDNNIAAIKLHSNQKHILLISILYKVSIEKKSAKIIMIDVYVILGFIESYYYTLNLGYMIILPHRQLFK